MALGLNYSLDLGHVSREEYLRVAANLQCRECHGVRITAYPRKWANADQQFVCEECGCQWSSYNCN
jgi:hypothetical protein